MCQHAEFSRVVRQQLSSLSGDLMNTPKLSHVLLAVSLVCSSVFAENRDVIVLQLPPTASVADVIRSPKTGNFVFPTAPQFTHRSLWQALPRGMSAYPATYETRSGTLPMASMVRFIQQSPHLFDSEAQYNGYKQALESCIQAHKEWQKHASAETLERLHAAENRVMEHLEVLRLQDGHVRARLEEILSSPTPAWITFAHQFVLPKRSWVKYIETNVGQPAKQAIVETAGFWEAVGNQKPLFIPLWAMSTLGCILVCLIRDKNALADDGTTLITSAGIGALVALAHSALVAPAAWLADYNLTPELGNGTKVVIDLSGPTSTSSFETRSTAGFGTTHIR